MILLLTKLFFINIYCVKNVHQLSFLLVFAYVFLFYLSYRIRRFCTWSTTRGWFDNIVLLFIALNCITLAMERPNIPPDSKERAFLSTANYVFTVVFAIEMLIKVNRNWYIYLINKNEIERTRIILFYQKP